MPSLPRDAPFGPRCGRRCLFSGLHRRFPLPRAQPRPTTDERLAALEAYIRIRTPAGRWPGLPGPGHNGWMMTCSALVLFMTLPGLALFYGGLVRRKNVSRCSRNAWGSRACDDPLVGGRATAWSSARALAAACSAARILLLRGVTSAPNTDYAFWVSQNVFAMYQLMFAIITPALIVGAIAERMKFSAVLLFVALLDVRRLLPARAHGLGDDGPHERHRQSLAPLITAIDFAGGTVVHMSSGWSALVLCMILGPRIGFGKERMPPHSMVLCMIGTGDALGGLVRVQRGLGGRRADGIAANAFTATTLATAVGCFTWGIIERSFRGHASILGFCSGRGRRPRRDHPGLTGFVTPSGAVVDRRLRGGHPVPLRHQVQGPVRLSTARPRHLRGPRRSAGRSGPFLTGFFATPRSIRT